MSGFTPANVARAKFGCIRENLLYSKKLTSFRQRKKIYNLRYWHPPPPYNNPFFDFQKEKREQDNVIPREWFKSLVRISFVRKRVIFADLVKKNHEWPKKREVVAGSRSLREEPASTGCEARPAASAGSDTKAAANFIGDFKKLVNSEGYLPQQVFNCDETGLFWKKMPKRTCITEEEIAFPGHKTMKDRLTLLFCANASGDLKIKLLLVYRSETPRAFKKCRRAG
ncbi:Tigger transposable element-derived protein 1 [Araneus ventricosus]|uniref:Tigger transposable element-derived protein 1 n=1 Tax=Araneus ventricosus TaxID=182803 RepID=A0A4Y2T8S6_ARAVE|nr:Tigger transposable element-derived protein 1 [Araneus ventricosus]